jgi:hypothetical protein
VADEIEITDDVLPGTIGTLNRSLDNSSFDVGIFRYGDMSLQLRNDHGRYSSADTEGSIFLYKRSGVKLRIAWELEHYPTYCGTSICGEVSISDEVNVFYGLLEDISNATDIKDQVEKFQVLSLESVIEKSIFPFASVSNGDLVSSIIFDALNQTAITNVLTVNALNIDVGLDQAVDDVSSLENKTVKEALSDLLLISNSIVFVENQTVYVRNRDPNATLEFTFYGQASNDGIENIMSITNIRTGISRLFNFFQWADTNIVSQQSESVTKFGVSKKSLDSELITNTTKQSNILVSYKDEFAFAKRELEITTPVNYETLALAFLDRVNIDNPTILFPGSSEDFSFYGQAVDGEARYASGVFSLTIDSVDEWKIIGRKLDMKNQSITFNLRAI